MARTIVIARLFLRYSLLLALIAPLIIIRTSWSPTNFGKVIIFRIIVEVALATWIFLLLTTKDYRPRISLISLGVIIFGLSYLVSTLAGANISMSFWGGYERMGGFFNFLHYILFFLMLTSVFESEEDWSLVIHLVVLIGIGSAIYGWLQLGDWKFILGAGARQRIFGTIGNPAMFAGYELFVFYWLIFLGAVKKRLRYTYFVFALFIAVSIILSYVRGAVLALLVSMALLIITYLIYKKQKIKLLVASIASLIIIVGVFSHFGFKFNFFSRLTIGNNQSTWIQRIYVWQEGIKGFQARPLLGWGPENFTLVHEHYFDPRIYLAAGGSIFDRAHNIFIEILTTQGIGGLMASIFLIWTVILALKNHSPPIRYVIMVSLVAYGIQSMFFFDSVSVYIMLVLVLAYLSQYSKPFNFSLNYNLRSIKLLGVILMLSIPISIYFLSIEPFIANTISARSAIVLSSGDIKNGMRLFEQSLNHNSPASYKTDIVLNITPVFLDILDNKINTLTQSEAKDYLSFFINQYKIIIKNNPQLSEGYTGINAVYIPYAHYVDNSVLVTTETELRKDLDINPTMVNIWLELGNLQSIENKQSDAVVSFRRAYLLNPTYLESQFLLGKAEFLAGQQQGIIDIKSAITKGFNNLDDIIIIGQILNTHGYDKDLISLLKTLSSNDPNYLIYLAIAYKDSGDNTSAKLIADEMLNFQSTVGQSITKVNYETLAELYLYFHDIKKRTQAFEKAGVMLP